MSDLSAKNRAVQSATFPSSDFSQAVRDWIDAATERMEGANEPAKVCPNCGDDYFWSHAKRCGQPASEPAKVECPNCGDLTSENHEVVQSDGLEGGRRLFFYTCQQRISELDDRHNRMASPEYQAKVKADMSRRAVEIGVDRLVGISAFPVGNCPTCGELVAPWNKHAKYEGGYTCQPAQPEPAAPEMPEAVKWAIYQLRQNVRLWEIHGEQPASETDRKAADALESWWRTHAQPVAVGMTEELSMVLLRAEYGATEDERNPNLRDGYVARLKDAIAAVRQQAAQGRKVELPKVRDMLNSALAQTTSRERRDEFLAALAELDAAEGEGGR